MDISIVIPVKDEEKNIKPLVNDIKDILNSMKISYEIIIVNDHSSDNTLKCLKNISKLKILDLLNYNGQGYALRLGIKQSIAKYIITMDGDGQNLPEDIPLLFDEIKKGKYDFICGWRKNRKDPFLKRFFSRGAYILRCIILKDVYHDSGCTLKIFKSKVIKKINLKKDRFMFIPAILTLCGFSGKEIVVKHKERKYGKTKYNYFIPFWAGIKNIYYILYIKCKYKNVQERKRYYSR